jgi:hypothetical protein
MEPTIAKLRSDLERFKNLRAAITDPRTRLILSEIIAENRVRRLGTVAAEPALGEGETQRACPKRRRLRNSVCRSFATHRSRQ